MGRSCQNAMQCDEQLAGYVGAFGDVTLRPIGGGGAKRLLSRDTNLGSLVAFDSHMYGAANFKAAVALVCSTPPSTNSEYIDPSQK